MTQISPAKAERALDAVLNIAVEGTSENPTGYGPPYRAPWFVIDKSTAEPDVNWPGELIEEVNEPGQVHKALRRARIAALIAALEAE